MSCIILSNVLVSYVNLLALLFLSTTILTSIDWFTNNLYIRKKILTIALTWVALAASSAIFIFMVCNILHYLFIMEFNHFWIRSGIFDISWSFTLDSIVSTMLIVVVPTSFLIHIFSIEYMANDRNFTRFIGYLSFFSPMMVVLVSSSNFLQLFLGWEGIGLASYLLIGFWYTRVYAVKAAIKAVIMNRIGDLAISIALALIFMLSGTLDFYTLFAIIPTNVLDITINTRLDIALLEIITILLLIGAMAKSAQIFLQGWLPDAMEGPTPVSALIHAATLVTAGVFSIIRCSHLFEFTPRILMIVMLVGSLTTVYAAIVAPAQNDLKRVIAFSTCSQLGYMFIACGTSNYPLALFHLMNHAYFKALLFLAAGAIIHAIFGQQDIRRMGGLIKKMPFTFTAIMIGSFALMGVPFLSGFYSKHPIMETTLAVDNTSTLFVFICSTMGAFLTAFYSTRLLYYVFNTKCNISLLQRHSVIEPGWAITLPITILGVTSIIGGYLFNDIFVGFGTMFHDMAIHISPQHFSSTQYEYLLSIIKFITNIVTVAGIVTATILYSFYFEKLSEYQINNIFINRFYKFCVKKWYMDLIYNQIILKNLLKFSYSTIFKVLDRGILQELGANGVIRFFPASAFVLSTLQTGSIVTYINIILIVLIFFICVI